MNRVALCALLLASACGGGSSDGAVKDSGAVYATDLATKLGCQDLSTVAAADRQLFVADQGDCTFDGAKVSIYRFSTNAARDNWIDTAKQFGIGRFVVVDRGVVTSEDQSAADGVKSKIGGEVRTS